MHVIVLFRPEGIQTLRNLSNVLETIRQENDTAIVFTKRPIDVQQIKCTVQLRVLDLSDFEVVRSMAVAEQASHREIRILPLLEDDIKLGAYLNDALGLPGIDIEAANLFRNKNDMYERCEQVSREHSLSINFTSYQTVNTKKDALDFARNEGFPVVLKPIDGMGAMNTHFVRNSLELERAWNAAAPDGAVARPMRVESYIDGVQYHADGIVVNGEPVFRVIGYYTTNILEFRSAPPGVVMHVSPESLEETIILQSSSTIALELGLQDGAYHSEFYVTQDGMKPKVYFGEIAARPPGGPIIPLINYCHNVDFICWWTKASLGYPHDLHASDLSLGKNAGIQILSSPEHGRIVRVVVASELLDRKDVDIEVFCRAGDIVEAPRWSSAGTMGLAICTGPSDVAIQELMQACLEAFCIETTSL